MFGISCCQAIYSSWCSGDPDRVIYPKRCACPYPVWQWGRVHRQASAQLAVESAGQAAVHWTGQPLGKWIHWIIQWEDERRAAKWRDFLHVKRSWDFDWNVEEGIQHDQAAQCFGLQTTGASCDHDSHYPITASWTNIRSGTNNGGTSWLVGL